MTAQDDPVRRVLEDAAAVSRRRRRAAARAVVPARLRTGARAAAVAAAAGALGVSAAAPAAAQDAGAVADPTGSATAVALQQDPPGQGGTPPGQGETPGQGGSGGDGPGAGGPGQGGGTPPGQGGSPPGGDGVPGPPVPDVPVVGEAVEALPGVVVDPPVLGPGAPPADPGLGLPPPADREAIAALLAPPPPPAAGLPQRPPRPGDGPRPEIPVVDVPVDGLDPEVPADPTTPGVAAPIIRPVSGTTASQTLTGDPLGLVDPLAADDVVPDEVPEETAVHVVQPGESLWTIATDLLAEAGAVDPAVEEVQALVDAIAELNRDVVADPDLLEVGTQLVLPADVLAAAGIADDPAAGELVPTDGGDADGAGGDADGAGGDAAADA